MKGGAREGERSREGSGKRPEEEVREKQRRTEGSDKKGLAKDQTESQGRRAPAACLPKVGVVRLGGGGDCTVFSGSRATAF